MRNWRQIKRVHGEDGDGGGQAAMQRQLTRDSRHSEAKMILGEWFAWQAELRGAGCGLEVEQKNFHTKSSLKDFTRLKVKLTQEPM